MKWETYKKRRMKKLSKVRDALGKALTLIEEMQLDESRNLQFNVSKSKADIEWEMFMLSRTGENDESVYQHHVINQGLPIEGFEYVDVQSAARIRCLFPDGMRTFYMDRPMYWVNIISIREYLDGIQDEEEQDQIME